MRNSKRLKTVHKLAAHRERDAARALADSQRTLDQRRAQLEELKSFSAEYSLMLQQAALNGLGATRLRDYHAFVERLHRAVAEQTRAVQQIERVVERQRGAWSNMYAHSKAVEDLVSRREKTERQEALRHLENDAEDIGHAGVRHGSKR